MKLASEFETDRRESQNHETSQFQSKMSSIVPNSGNRSPRKEQFKQTKKQMKKNGNLLYENIFQKRYSPNSKVKPQSENVITILNDTDGSNQSGPEAQSINT